MDVYVAAEYADTRGPLLLLLSDISILALQASPQVAISNRALNLRALHSSYS